MSPSPFDALVVGAGPAGATAALVLARGGARVAIVDKAAFPRDKACGDLVGPRGLRLLSDLGLKTPPGPTVGDMLVLGPTGRRARLPSAAGLTYPGHALVAPRSEFDRWLYDSAVAAGAVPFTARADRPLGDGGLEGFRLSSGEEIRADFVIGADGATSRVAAAAGLVDEARVLWGFAVRSYQRLELELPVIAFWEPQSRRAYPGYGWAFPGMDGCANVGIGAAARGGRGAGTAAVRALPAFLDHLVGLGLADGKALDTTAKLGGWLKMGMVGTIPASGRVLLVGDAAGLVNPLQGEGIAQALTSGRAAAGAVLEVPGMAASCYRAELAAQHLPYHRVTAILQGWLLDRPRLLSTVARVLTTAGGVDALAGGWAVYWNELLEGAPRGTHRRVATVADRVGRALTSRGDTARWFRSWATEPEHADFIEKRQAVA